MTDRTPSIGRDAVKVGLGRSNAVVALAVLGFLGWVVWAGAHGAWTSTEKSAQVIGYGVAALFAIPLVMMLRALPRFLSPRYVVFDAAGLRILHGSEQVFVPWHDVIALGIGYEQASPEQPTLPTSVDGLKDAAKGYLADKATEALQISDKRRLALEIFPVRPDAVDQYPKLKPYWKQETPPVAGLPALRWRFPLPPVVTIAQAVSRGAQAFQGQRWLGWFSRPRSGTSK